MTLADGALAALEVNADSGYGYEVDVKVSAETGSAETASLSSAIVSSASTRGQWVEDDWLQRFETAYVDEGLLVNVEYSYRVRATNYVGASGFSNIDTARTSNAPWL